MIDDARFDHQGSLLRGMQNIEMSMQSFMSVCLSYRMSQKPHVQTLPIAVFPKVKTIFFLQLCPKLCT